MTELLSKRREPSDVFVYARESIPREYIEKLNGLGVRVAVEPWAHGEEEPIPSVDLTSCDVLLTMGWLDRLDILTRAPNVRWIHSISVGVDAFSIPERLLPGLTVTNSKGCTSVPIAEHALALILALARGVPSIVERQAGRQWGGRSFATKELYGSTVGIIGYGEIGAEIGRRCKGLGMRVLGCRKHPGKSRHPSEIADLVVDFARADEVIAQSDVLVLSLPSTEETIGFMNKRRLQAMKKDSFLVNVGRGSAIVEKDLAECLQRGMMAGAALDVFEQEPLPADHPLWDCPNVLISPHVAYDSPKNIDRCMELFLHNLTCYLRGEPLKNVVDMNAGY